MTPHNQPWKMLQSNTKPPSYINRSLEMGQNRYYPADHGATIDFLGPKTYAPTRWGVSVNISLFHHIFFMNLCSGKMYVCEKTICTTLRNKWFLDSKKKNKIILLDEFALPWRAATTCSVIVSCNECWPQRRKGFFPTDATGKARAKGRPIKWILRRDVLTECSLH